MKTLNENLILTSTGVSRSSSTEDQYFGFVRHKSKILMGIKEINFRDDKLIVDNIEYNCTAGLWSLINDKNPQAYIEKDLDAYRSLVLQTDVINNPNNISEKSRPRTTTKFRHFLKPIMEDQAEEESGRYK